MEGAEEPREQGAPSAAEREQSTRKRPDGQRARRPASGASSADAVADGSDHLGDSKEPQKSALRLRIGTAVRRSQREYLLDGQRA